MDEFIFVVTFLAALGTALRLMLPVSVGGWSHFCDSDSVLTHLHSPHRIGLIQYGQIQVRGAHGPGSAVERACVRGLRRRPDGMPRQVRLAFS